MSRRREALGFIARAVALLLALALVWPLFAPAYSLAVATAASGFLGDPIDVWVDGQGNLQADKRWYDRSRLQRDASPLGVRGSWESLLLVSALILATPRLGWRRRSGLLALGLALIFLYHALYVTVYFRQIFLPSSRVYVWFPFTEVWVPLFVWAALTFGFWFKTLAGRPLSRSAG